MEYFTELFEYNGLYKKQSFFFFKENFNLFVFWIYKFENIYYEKKMEY